jgi:hypothetical protein
LEVEATEAHLAGTTQAVRIFVIAAIDAAKGAAQHNVFLVYSVVPCHDDGML